MGKDGQQHIPPETARAKRKQPTKDHLQDSIRSKDPLLSLNKLYLLLSPYREVLPRDSEEWL